MWKGLKSPKAVLHNDGQAREIGISGEGFDEAIRSNYAG
ncbi:hypothetical protein C7374_102334 [Falsochrobactrum ovis]|uniref:Uncharacterized protein n=1 Tax=Falsochrobactrum ovis TaxID=1293442 RepID=A0A364JYF8_9HYPH|nr:hypothetical protein C7374_102334 [Falsochrobactrum ovis]